MILENDIVNNFAEVQFINEILRFHDVVPALNFCYYLKLDNESGRDLLAVTDGFEDDEFARTILAFSQKIECENERISKHQLGVENSYQFSHLLFAPPTFHSYFKGRLDSERTNLILVLPIHNCEFSGNESLEEFLELRKRTNSGLNWKRSVTPKVLVRFDNPLTGGGTDSAQGILVDFGLVEREVQNLSGASMGFIEITSFRGDFAEILSPAPDQFTFRTQSDEVSRPMGQVELIERIQGFLTAEE